MQLLWYGFRGKHLSIFSRPVDIHGNTFLDDLKPDTGNSSEKEPCSKEAIIIMNRSRCPHCRQKPGDFLYADASPRCQQGAPAKPSPRGAAPASVLLKRKLWPVRAFVRFVPLCRELSHRSPEVSMP
jgi:hypothetical protein